MPGNPRVPGIRRRGRLRLLLGVVAADVVATVVPSGPGVGGDEYLLEPDRENSGYYYQMWSTGQGSACINMNSGNSYTSSWNGIGDFVAGVGWNPGNSSTKSFTGSLNASGGTSLVSLYGWSTGPLVEYYVMENYVGSPPTAGTYMGQVTSDGGTFNIYEHQQVNQPSIQGTATFEQYLAIRTSPVSSGTITMSNFFNAWASHGMNLGTLNYQILATEAWGGGSGNSNVSVSSGGRRRWWRRRRRRRRGRRRRRRVHSDAVGRFAGEQLVQPQRRRHRLQHLDRDDEPRLARCRLQHVERQRHMAQPVRDGRQTERERQQLGRHDKSERPMDMAISVL